jgi:hypothetical protein
LTVTLPGQGAAMSSEPIASGRRPGEPPPGPQRDARPDAPTAFSAEAAQVIAAIDRMQAVLRNERATLARLREALLATARTVADAKAALDQPAEFAELFDVLQHRFDALVKLTSGEIAALSEPQPPGASRSEARAEPADAVPTVSRVVSRLGRGETTPVEDAEEAVARLKGMVEALRAEFPPETAWPAEEAAGRRASPERALIESAVQLQALPILPAEVGSAVIFARAEASPPAPSTTAEPRAAPAAASEPVAPEAMTEEPEPVLELDASAVVEPGSAGTEPPPADAEQAPVYSDRDLSAFLFGPDPPVERLAFQPPPSPPSPPAVDLMQPAAKPAEMPSAPEHATGAPAATSPPEPMPPAAPPPSGPAPASSESEPLRDPLAPLNAMTAEARLALFS